VFQESLFSNILPSQKCHVAEGDTPIWIWNVSRLI